MPQTEGKDGPVDLQIEAKLDFDRLVVMGGRWQCDLSPGRDPSRRARSRLSAVAPWSARLGSMESQADGPDRYSAARSAHSINGATISIDQV